MTEERSRDWQQRFDAFAARKMQTAIRADLSPMVTADDSRVSGRAGIGNAWSRRLFDGPFYLSPAADNRRPATSLVFVQTADGNTGAGDPAALGGGATDTHLIYEGLSRVAADAVMAGAGTVRGAGVFSVWHPEMVALRAALGLPRHPAQIVATNRGLRLDDELLFNVPSIRVVLLTGAPPSRDTMDALGARPWITHLPVHDGNLRDTFQRLRDIGIGRVSCVGGRTLARALLESGLVDDVYLTTAPISGGEPDTPIAAWAWRGQTILEKHGTGIESGVTFEQIAPASVR